ncbi:MAG: hypothetical protein GX454_09180 [Brooklawnia sp.]|nr:hypothetical protein [Brooklawnia sp.]
MVSEPRPTAARPEANDEMHTLVMRAWGVPEQDAGFRARLTFSVPGEDDPDVRSVATPELALAAVQEWLQGIVMGDGSLTRSETAGALANDG